MNRNAVAVVLSLILGGCAPYIELEPRPEILPVERGYIELKNDKDNFGLEGGKKYFIKFPKPMADRFDLVLVTPSKPFLTTHLTRRFDDQETPADRVPDESSTNDSVSVYAIDPAVPISFWVIDSVQHDLQLVMHYRYVPAWRYTFETKYALYKEILARNAVDRSTYDAIDVNFNFANVSFAREIVAVGEKTGRIKGLKEELDRLEAIFPKGIAATADTAFEQYLDLRQHVDGELKFQEDYSTILSLFQKVDDTRGDIAGFMDAIPFFTSVVSQRDRFPGRVMARARKDLLTRLDGVAAYYEPLLQNKEDIAPIVPEPELDKVSALYTACDRQIPPEVERMIRFVARFNTESHALQVTEGKFRELRTAFTKGAAAPPAGFYANLLSRVADIRSSIPESQVNRFAKYGNYTCAVKMGAEIAGATGRVNRLQSLYTTAQTITGHIASRAWPAAETSLRQLSADNSFGEFPAIGEEKAQLVKRLDGDIFSGVKLASQQRVDAFVQLHATSIDDVPGLYKDSSFTPVYALTFSSLGAADLAQKQKQIVDYLARKKYYEFPENAIKGIYREFSANIADRGVDKARAIVEHGRMYKGDDKQVLALVNECNVDVPKWIVKPKEYRRVFVLPVTNNQKGMNEYMFRVRLNMPSEAQFPVYDVNIKLPEEVARKSGSVAWYESITINKQPIKNEGRYRITAPTAANNYESLITPVQMDKEGANVLEVRFKYPAYKVFEVSAMAQVPIIRKN